MSHISEDIKINNKVVNQAFEKRVINHEQGFRQVTHRPLQDDRIVVVAHHRQDGIGILAIAVPNILQCISIGE
ncbi:hypothetical protein D3C72_2468270 [compost metagenome]